MATISPSQPQFDYITSKAQFPAMVAGFGAGKTEAAIMRAIIGKLLYPMCNRGFYLPTYDLVRNIAFPRFEAALESLGIGYRLFKSPLNYLEIPNCGKIIFRSMDAPHRIIGYEHADADCDELDTLKKDDAAEIWLRVVSRNRQKKPDGAANTIGVTTTPEGFKFVYEAWKSKPRKGHVIIQAPTYSNPHLPAGYIDSMRDQFPAQQLDAYIEGEFVNLTSGTIYNEFDRDKHNTDVEWDGREPLHIGLDFNVCNMSAVISVIRKNVCYGVDEITGGYDTPSMIETIKQRYQNCQINIYPDASGRNRNAQDASASSIQLLRHAGFQVLAKNRNPFVKDRILSVNMSFKKGLHFVNSDKCPVHASNLEQQIYNKAGEPDKSQNTDHTNDACGYLIHYKFPIVKPTTNASRMIV